MSNRSLQFVLISLLMLVASCGSGGSIDGTPTPTPIPAFPSGDTLIAVSTVSADYSTGTLSLIDPLTFAIEPDIAVVTSDTIVRSLGDRLFVFARIFGGDDTITVYDARSFNIVGEIPIDGGANPQDLAVIGDYGYISLYNGGGILVFNVDTLAVVTTIDLSEWADSDGDSNVSDLLVHGGKLYAGLQRVDYTAGFEPASPGYIVEINPSTNLVDRALQLTGSNVGAMIAQGGALVAACGGSYTTTEGGIERVDLATGNSQGYIVLESDLAWGSVGNFTVAGGVGYLSDGGALVAFDLTSGDSLDVASAAAGLAVGNLWTDGGNQLWLSSEGALTVVDVAANAILTTSPLDVGENNPYSLAFLDLTQ